MLAYEPQSTAFWLQLAPLWRVPVDISDHCTPCYLRPLSPLSAEPAGVPIPQGVVDLCTAVSGSFRRPKVRVVEASTTSTGAAQTVSPYVTARRSLVDLMVFLMGLEARLSQGAQPGRAGRARPTSSHTISFFTHCTTPLHACAENSKTNLSPVSSLASVARGRGHALYVCRVSTARAPLCAFTEPGRAHPAWIRRTAHMATHAGGSGSSRCHLPTGNLALRL